MKKRTVAYLTAAAAVCVALVGGTLAYFTDTDADKNVFTTSKVDIDLVEQQRAYADDGTLAGLEEFDQGKVLYPIVGSAQGEKDAMGMPVAANYVDKIITVENLVDSSDAYVRVYIGIPTVLDNVGDASQNVLHGNQGNNFFYGDDYAASDHANWGAETLLTTNYVIEVDEGVEVAYNIYYRDYNKVLPADTETGSAAYIGFYLDEDVDYDTVNKYYTIDGEKIEMDLSKGITIPVFAVGVQAAGFDTAAEAVDAAFGAGFNPWATA